MALNSARVGIGLSHGRHVWARPHGDLTEICVEGRKLLAPGLRRWRQYKDGFQSRLSTVAHRYGLGHVGPAQEDMWALDVGGYMGEWSLHMLNLGYKVLVIEPDPPCARCLKENLRRNAPEGAVWLHDPRVALNENKTITFYSQPQNADGSIFASDKHKSVPIVLEGKRLDEIIAERIGDAPVKVFKMDAEGAEPEVLAGAPKLLATVTHVGIDAGPERMGQDTVADCVRILREAGLTVIDSPPMVVAASRLP